MQMVDLPDFAWYWILNLNWMLLNPDIIPSSLLVVAMFARFPRSPLPSSPPKKRRQAQVRLPPPPSSQITISTSYSQKNTTKNVMVGKVTAKFKLAWNFYLIISFDNKVLTMPNRLDAPSRNKTITSIPPW